MGSYIETAERIVRARSFFKVENANSCPVRLVHCNQIFGICSNVCAIEVEPVMF